eukprot:COSAG01_NODE_5922_length_3950_cov_3.461958_1_plen_45_part_00
MYELVGIPTSALLYELVQPQLRTETVSHYSCTSRVFYMYQECIW